MAMQVDQEFCAGCGACVDVCSVGAIQLVDWRGVIDENLCTGCEACIEACPNEAITMRSIQEPVVSIVRHPVAGIQPVPARDQTALPEASQPERSLATMAGAALAFLGREAAPRLVDVVISALERRLERSSTTAVTPLSTSSRGITTQSRGKHRQARCRGGRNAIQKRIEELTTK